MYKQVNLRKSRSLSKGARVHACFENAFAVFIESSNSGYYVEGYISVNPNFQPDIDHAWIEIDGEIIDPTLPVIYDDEKIATVVYEAKYRYSWDEIQSLVDLVEDGTYRLPLSYHEYGRPKFTRSMAKFMQAQRLNGMSQKASIRESAQDSRVMYDDPIGPRRRTGRPKKIRWSDAVQSSNLEHVYYDLYEERMTVDFHSGYTYDYYGVPQKRYQNLKRAKSKGKYFHKYIRFSYPYKMTK